MRSQMMRTLAEANWGISIIEDTDTGEVSFQCMCGQVGMYSRRIVLTDQEARDFRSGHLDIDQLVRDVCREVAHIAGRIVPSIPESQLE